MSATGKRFNARSLDEEGLIDVRWGTTRFDDLWLNVFCSTYGLQFSVDLPQDEYLVVVPEVGTAELGCGQVLTTLAPEKDGAILSLPQLVEWRSHGATSTILLRVSRPALETHAEQFVETPLQRPIVFTPRMNIASGYTGCVARVLQSVVRDIEGGAPSLHHSTMISGVRDTILAWLLIGQTNNNTHRLEANARADNRTVRYAEEYIEAHLNDSISMPDLARIAKVSVRALQIAFKKHRGVSPLTFLKERRLTRARELLLAGASGVRVTDVASRCGFNHLGQFSVDYRRRFGEKPIDTLRRTRVPRAT
jgi:AraC-like DNA-binding protein